MGSPGCTCRDTDSSGHQPVDTVHREGVELLVGAPHELVLEQVPTLPIELKQGHVLLHGDI